MMENEGKRRITRRDSTSEFNKALNWVLNREKKKDNFEAKFETARNFLQMGLSIEQVAIGTGLDVEEVTQIQALDSDSE